MNISPYIVRCPNCSSRLPVSEVQMQQADGDVRCAKCQTVFYAREHLLSDNEIHSKTLQAQRELLFDLSEEDTPQSPPHRPQPKSVAKPTPVLANENSRQRPVNRTTGKSEDDKTQPQGDIEWRSDVHKTPKEQPNASGEVIREGAELRHTPFHRAGGGVKKRPKGIAHRWLWWLGIWILIVSIAITLFIINFDKWSRQPLLRGVYSYACMWSDCDVPRDMVPVLMEVRAGQVSLGPGVYRIQGAVRNNAFYPQPLPVIRLEFIDLQNKTHASRIFSQNEYADDATTMLKPGRGVPFTLEVELVDPVQFRLVPRFVLLSY